MCWADTTFMCQMSWNLGAWTSWKPQGLSSPVMGLLYLFIPNIYGLRMEIKVISYFVWAKDIRTVHIAHPQFNVPPLPPTFFYMWPRIYWKEQNGSTILTWIKDDNIFLIHCLKKLEVARHLCTKLNIGVKYWYFAEDWRLSKGGRLILQQIW